MENNITAVQFIKEQIELNSDTSFFNIDWDKFDEIIEQAKEMEKMQIFKAKNVSAKEAYESGQFSMYCGCYDINGCTSYEEWLYDKTFKL